MHIIKFVCCIQNFRTVLNGAREGASRLGPNPIHGRDEADVVLTPGLSAVLKSYLKGEADAVLRNGQQAVDSVSLLSLTLSLSEFRTITKERKLGSAQAHSTSCN